MPTSIPSLTALVIDKNEQKTSKPKKINHSLSRLPIAFFITRRRDGHKLDTIVPSDMSDKNVVAGW
jgi:hypothetical protein